MKKEGNLQLNSDRKRSTDLYCLQQIYYNPCLRTEKIMHGLTQARVPALTRK